MDIKMKNLPIAFFLSLCIWSACDSNDPIEDKEITKTPAQLSIKSCDSIHYHGRLERGTALNTENYFSVMVNVSAKGTYTFKTEDLNGYHFVAEGEFTATGLQELRFVGAGTPQTAQVDNVTLKFGNATCGQKLMVYEENYPNPDSTVIFVTGEPFFSDYNYTYAFNGHGKQLWRIDASSPPAISGDIAYMITDDEVYARDIATGNPVWNTSMGLSLHDGPVTMDGDDLFIAGNGKLMSISRLTGAVNWTYTFGIINYVMQAPTVAGGKVFEYYDEHLYCLDLDGNLVWKYPVSNAVRSNPALADGILYFGNNGGTFRAINVNDTTTVWTHEIGMTGEESPTVDNGKVYIQGETQVFCFDALTGETIWTYTIESGTADWSSPLVANGKVYVAGFGKGVIALDASNGHELWNNTAPAQSADNPPAVLHSLLVEGGANGLAAINAISGATIWNIAPFTATTDNSISFYTPAVIYNRETGEVAYPSTSGHKH